MRSGNATIIVTSSATGIGIAIETVRGIVAEGARVIPAPIAADVGPRAATSPAKDAVAVKDVKDVKDAKDAKDEKAGEDGKLVSRASPAKDANRARRANNASRAKAPRLATVDNRVRRDRPSAAAIRRSTRSVSATPTARKADVQPKRVVAADAAADGDAAVAVPRAWVRWARRAMRRDATGRTTRRQAARERARKSRVSPSHARKNSARRGRTRRTSRRRSNAPIVVSLEPDSRSVGAASAASSHARIQERLEQSP